MEPLTLAMPVAVKRVYEKPASSDGQRVLVDRLWPRGLKKEEAGIHHWLKDLAPSDELRKWFHARANWLVFRKRYLLELSCPEAAADLERLYDLLREHDRITLVYAFHDEGHNNAVVLKELLEGTKKPPSSSGPAHAAASGRAIRRRPAR